MFFFFTKLTHTHTENKKAQPILVIITHNKCMFLYTIGGIWIVRQNS